MVEVEILEININIVNTDFSRNYDRLLKQKLLPFIWIRNLVIE